MSVKLVFPLVLLIGTLCTTAWAQEYYGQPAQQPTQGAATYDWTFTTSVNYSTGDFGTSSTTNTVYVPFTLQRNLSQGRVYLTIPYIDQQSGPGVQAVGGRPFRVNGGAGNSGWAGGLGDVILGGSYDLLREPDRPMDLSGFASVKFPSADQDKNLGTGEFDETLGLAGSKGLGGNWSALGRIGYTFIGDPPGMDLDNHFFYAAGVGYQWTKETFSSISYEERTRLVNGRPNPRDLVLGVDHQLNETTGIFGNLGFGLSEGSPDISVTAGMSLWF